MLNPQKGNMYPFVTHTWNPIKGKCPHDCVYCYMKVFPQKPMRLDEKTLKDDLGKGNFIFVGSSTDIWAEGVERFWIDSVLKSCKAYPENWYLFQTKNPERYNGIELPDKSFIACTIESNREYPISKAPSVKWRRDFMASYAVHMMISIEPILDFDLPEFIDMIDLIHPDFVSIGADSKNHHLPEPSSDKIRALIEALGKITQVVQKDNLKRLM